MITTPANAADDRDEEMGGGCSSPPIRTSSTPTHSDDKHHPASSFLSSIVHFNTRHNAADEARNSERSSTSSKWRSLGSRHVKFGMSSQSDIDSRRGILAIPMCEETSKPMNSVDRLKKTFWRSSFTNEDEKEELAGKKCDEKQIYRLQLTRENEMGCLRRSFACLLACLNCGAHTESSTEQNLFLGLGSPNRWLIDFFYWLFRKGWFTIFAVSLVMFYLLVIFFAVLIIWAAVMDSDCIRVGDDPFTASATRSLAAQVSPGC